MASWREWQFSLLLMFAKCLRIVGSALRVAATGLCFAQSRPAALTVLTGALVTLGATTLSYNFHAYQSERYPTRVRARATGFVYARRRLSGIFSGFLVAYALRGGGVSATLLLIAAAWPIDALVIGVLGLLGTSGVSI